MKRILALAAILAALVFSQKSAVAVIPQTVNPAAAVTGDTMNTPNTVVYRDSNGDFQTGNISDANLGQGRVVYTQAGGVLASSSTFTVSPEGNHGIGAPNPKQALQISSGTVLIDAGSQATSFQIGASTFVVQGGGNVGIGTAVPGAPLEVNGTIVSSVTALAAADIIIDAENTSFSLSSILRFNQHGVQKWGFYNDYDQTGSNRLDIRSGVGGATLGLSILSGGNVGIGTTAPGAVLDVRGASFFGTAPTQSTAAANGDFYVNGKLGVGSVNPTKLLHVSSGSIYVDGTSPNIQSEGSIGEGVPGGSTDANYNYWMMTSTDGATQSTGCVVTYSFSSNLANATLQFTSTTTASTGSGIGVLMQSCAPGAVCKVGIGGIFRIITVSAATKGDNAVTSTTRCQVTPVTGNPLAASRGTFMSSTAGAASSGWFTISPGSSGP